MMDENSGKNSKGEEVPTEKNARASQESPPSRSSNVAGSPTSDVAFGDVAREAAEQMIAGGLALDDSVSVVISPGVASSYAGTPLAAALAPLSARGVKPALDSVLEEDGSSVVTGSAEANSRNYKVDLQHQSTSSPSSPSPSRKTDTNIIKHHEEHEQQRSRGNMKDDAGEDASTSEEEGEVALKEVNLQGPPKHEGGNVASVLAAFQMGIDEIEENPSGATKDGDKDHGDDGVAEQITTATEVSPGPSVSTSPSRNQAKPLQSDLDEVDMDLDLEAHFASRSVLANGGAGGSSSTTSRRPPTSGQHQTTRGVSGHNSVGVRGLLNHGDESVANKKANEFIMSSKPAGKTKFVARQDTFEAAMRQKMQQNKAATSNKGAKDQSAASSTKRRKAKGALGEGVDEADDVQNNSEMDNPVVSQSSEALSGAAAPEPDTEMDMDSLGLSSASRSPTNGNGGNTSSAPSVGKNAGSFKMGGGASSLLSQYRNTDLKENLERRLQREILESRQGGRHKEAKAEGESFPSSDLAAGNGNLHERPAVEGVDEAEAEERRLWEELERAPKPKKMGIQPVTENSLVSHREFVQDYIMKLDISSYPEGEEEKGGKLCCLEVGSSLRGDLMAEKKLLWTLAFRTDFSPSSEPMHHRALGTLYRKLTHSPAAPLLVDSRWEVLGFQGTNPSSDLNRFGGLCNVWHAVRFLWRDAALLEKIWLLSQNGAQEFPFMCTSIQLTKLSLDILFPPHLTDRGASGGVKVTDIYRSARSKLLRFLSSRGTVLEGLALFQNSMLYGFYDRWSREMLTIMDFGRVAKEIDTAAARDPIGFVNRYEEYVAENRRANDPSRLEFTDLDRRGGSQKQVSREDARRLRQYAQAD
ncbi:unnamed protein product [Amoebophrya sp. A25]|nr:unnamed protein product [Amoebophrya sp. A25]|eukprot:GSA25T00011996001.1